MSSVKKLKPTPSQLEAHDRVRKALNLIEQAQALLGSACGELSPIMWGAAEHKRVGDMYDKVKALWYKVQQIENSPKIDLDPETKRSMGLA